MPDKIFRARRTPLLAALAFALVACHAASAQDAPAQLSARPAAPSQDATTTTPAEGREDASKLDPAQPDAARLEAATLDAATLPRSAEAARDFARTTDAARPAVPESEAAPKRPRAESFTLVGPAAPPAWQQTTDPYTPLTAEQKMKRAFRNAFFSPIGVGRTFVSSVITQWNEDSQPHKDTDDEIADGLSRFAINYSRRATRTLLGSGVYAVAFRQDPRYDRAEEGKNVFARAGHAVSRVFVQRGDSGNLQPAVSRWAGSLSASALSNLWERSTPGHDRIGTDATFKRFANSFVTDSINNLFVEFWPDIKKIFGR
jgi:hypothetical protein